MRLFTAIELNDKVKAALRQVQRALSAFDRTVRWVTPEQMHLTLKFLGEVPDGRVDEISGASARIARESSPFDLVIGGCGCFPPAGRVRVAWVGMDESSGALAACNERCEAEYAEIGFARERRAFSPHLTLGRVRDDRTDGRLRDAVEALQVEPLRQGVVDLRVIRSTLTPQGAQYAVVSRHRLGGPPAK